VCVCVCVCVCLQQSFLLCNIHSYTATLKQLRQFECLKFHLNIRKNAMFWPSFWDRRSNNENKSHLLIIATSVVSSQVVCPLAMPCEDGKYPVSEELFPLLSTRYQSRGHYNLLISSRKKVKKRFSTNLMEF